MSVQSNIYRLNGAGRHRPARPETTQPRMREGVWVHRPLNNFLWHDKPLDRVPCAWDTQSKVVQTQRAQRMKLVEMGRRKLKGKGNGPRSNFQDSPWRQTGGLFCWTSVTRSGPLSLSLPITTHLHTEHTPHTKGVSPTLMSGEPLARRDKSEGEAAHLPTGPPIRPPLSFYFI